jgi:hypothetical protein
MAVRISGEPYAELLGINRLQSPGPRIADGELIDPEVVADEAGFQSVGLDENLVHLTGEAFSPQRC